MSLKSRLKVILKEIDHGHEQTVEVLMWELIYKLRHINGILLSPGMPVMYISVMHDTEFDVTKTLSVGNKPHLKVNEQIKDGTVHNKKVVIPACDIGSLHGGMWYQHMIFEYNNFYFLIKMRTLVDYNCKFDYGVHNTLDASFGNIYTGQ